MPTTDPQLDVRSEPPSRRHQLIFDTYEALAAGAGFILVNDHDPKPLRYQFEAEHPDQFTW
ncbi:MAG: hemerythrin, partial [Solirubrobacterales bacterium 70-9]